MAIRILTYNVRYDSMPDSIPVNKTIDSLPTDLPQIPPAYYTNLTEQPWSTRRLSIANDILNSAADIYGGQELLKRQLGDIQELLGNEWASVGVGRDDGREGGEYSPIFWNKKFMNLLAWDTFWLTETPFDVSKHPDAGSYRVCTVAKFQTTSGTLTMLNTHLDDQSDVQRRLGLSLVLHRAKYEAIKTKRPVFVTGDFNSPPSDGAYKIIVGQKEPVAINQTFLDKFDWTAEEEKGFEKFVMQDLLVKTPAKSRSGNYATFTGFNSLNDTSEFIRIDYILAGSHGGWIAKRYHVGSNLDDNGIYHSDHRPVYADIKLL